MCNIRKTSRQTCYIIFCLLDPTFSIPITATCAFSFNPLTDEVNVVSVVCNLVHVFSITGIVCPGVHVWWISYCSGSYGHPTTPGWCKWLLSTLVCFFFLVVVTSRYIKIHYEKSWNSNNYYEPLFDIFQKVWCMYPSQILKVWTMGHIM